MREAIAAQARVAAHVVYTPPSPDWREQLAQRLGERPRRIGAWAELALHGALACLDASGKAMLPAAARVRVASRTATLKSVHAVAQQSRQGLPLPFAFMQSQPSQMLAALSRHLAWQGDAAFIASNDEQAVLQLALAGIGPAGLLLGWVEEDRRSDWWRLMPLD
jgi:hypothetical protein